MITLLACRPNHPLFKLAIKDLRVYPSLKGFDKLMYMDHTHLKYNKTSEAWARPEDLVYMAHPDYFLPTYDPGLKNMLFVLCRNRRFPNQKPKFGPNHIETCKELWK